MPSCSRFCLALLPIAALLVAGCKGAGTSMTECVPSCPAGTHCEESGCVLDGPAPDLATAGNEGGAGCNPACAGTTPFCNSGNQCVACLADKDCPIGSVCRVSGSIAVCVPGCADDSRCGDPSDPSMKCCNGQCTDTASDPQHCGACDGVCAVEHASASCTGGTCTTGACDTGWADCDRDPADGCETNLTADAHNCGACGSACSAPNAIAGCSNTCYVAACRFGFGDCNRDLGDGCEKTLLSDPSNCGECFLSCPKPPHAAATCVNAACALTKCDVGFADCNANPIDGCEVVVGSDRSNCGACGNACPQGLICTNGGCTCPQCNFANAKSKCLNNVCVLDACVEGWGDCNHDPKDGCEKDLTNDRDNCTACGMACPMGQNCFSGVCQEKFVFQMNQQIDGQTVTCSAVVSNQQYTECDDLMEANMYFPNGIMCGPFWGFQNPRLSDTIGFCMSLTGTARAESYYTCANSIPRAVWTNHVWSTTPDNGYTQHVRCYY